MAVIFKTNQVFYTLLLAVFLISGAFATRAFGAETLGEIADKNEQTQFWDWNLFKTNRGDHKVCYIVSTPIIQAGSSQRRGEPYFLVTNIPNDADEVTASSGFIYKAASDVEISFGSKKFYLFPYMAVSWADNSNDDIDIIKEMQRNDEMTVTGIARDNKIVQDTYSLIGFTKAYYRLKEECK